MVTGCVYFARSTKTGLIKIGSSRNVKQRMKTLSWAEGATVILLYAVRSRSPILDERHAQDCLKEYRVRGEWFRINDSHIQQARRSLVDLHRRQYEWKRGIERERATRLRRSMKA